MRSVINKKEAAITGLLSTTQASQPPERVLNNLLRYETTLERRLDKAIARLDWLQQQRRAAVAASRQAAAE